MGATVIVFVTGEVVEANVTRYDVRCDTALSRAWRIADSVVLYALVTRCCFITGTKLMNEIDASTMMSATTVSISIKLKPLARCRRCPAFVSRLFMTVYPPAVSTARNSCNWTQLMQGESFAGPPQILVDRRPVICP